jgi:putative flippase GtrA
VSSAKRQILLNTRMLKYGVVGCAGIVVNLGTMTLLLAVASRRGWMPSAIANIVSTLGNFFLHNLWTFSDRQHQGSRLVRGILSFALVSAVSICVTTAAYVAFTQIAVHLTIANSNPGGLRIPLVCQLIAIPLGSGVSYILNREFTWPSAQGEQLEPDITQVQEV